MFSRRSDLPFHCYISHVHSYGLIKYAQLWRSDIEQIHSGSGRWLNGVWFDFLSVSSPRLDFRLFQYRIRPLSHAYNIRIIPLCLPAARPTFFKYFSYHETSTTDFRRKGLRISIIESSLLYFNGWNEFFDWITRNQLLLRRGARGYPGHFYLPFPHPILVQETMKRKRKSISPAIIS